MISMLIEPYGSTLATKPHI